MLSEFASGQAGLAGLGEKIITVSGFPVVGIAPTYPGLTSAPWGPGSGAWQVDYHVVAEAFWKFVETHCPVAIMSFGMTPSTQLWELEPGVVNLQNVPTAPLYTTWAPNDHDNYPFVGGGVGDPADAQATFQGYGTPVDLPNYGASPIAGTPPDTTRSAGQSRTLPGLASFQQSIVSSLNSDPSVQQIPGYNSDAIAIGQLMTTDPGDQFLCAYTGYLVTWYQMWVPQSIGAPCSYAWFRHVSDTLSVRDATMLFDKQLQLLIGLL